MSETLTKYLVRGYYPTIGIECHVQLKTKTKLFTSVSNEAREAAQNTLVGHVCFGLPGALPVLNGEAVKLAAYAAYALGTTPQKFSKFDRKHYFYPDLPKGYQISQFDQPIIIGGSIKTYLDDGTEKSVAITRAHLEEDAGKSTHPTGTAYSLVDLNRAGTPLLEIVSEPEMQAHSKVPKVARPHDQKLSVRSCPKYCSSSQRIQQVHVHGKSIDGVTREACAPSSGIGGDGQVGNWVLFKSVSKHGTCTALDKPKVSA